MKVSLIVAVSAEGVIGRDGDLPWRLPGDLKRFKRLTMGHHLIVGRRTWDSIGRPLPGRSMIVISRSDPELPAGVVVAGSIDEALDYARDAGEDEAFVAGGAAIYALALPLADRLYWTQVRGAVAGDVRFPDFDASDWSLVSCVDAPRDDGSSHEHTFLVYDRSPRA